MAMRVKDRGIWQHYTWKDYCEKVKDLCLGMVSLGFERDHVTVEYLKRL